MTCLPPGITTERIAPRSMRTSATTRRSNRACPGCTRTKISRFRSERTGEFGCGQHVGPFQRVSGTEATTVSYHRGDLEPDPGLDNHLLWLVNFGCLNDVKQKSSSSPIGVGYHPSTKNNGESTLDLAEQHVDRLA